MMISELIICCTMSRQSPVVLCSRYST